MVNLFAVIYMSLVGLHLCTIYIIAFDCIVAISQTKNCLLVQKKHHRCLIFITFSNQARSRNGLSVGASKK